MPFKIGLKTRRKKMLEQELKRIIPILIKLGAEKIILFGSLAKGNVHKSSDFDLFIVMNTDKDFMERLDEVYKACNPCVAVDFFRLYPQGNRRWPGVSCFAQRNTKVWEGNL